MLSANSEHFTPFPAWISFIFLLWMPWLGPPELCWIKVVRVDGHACLVLILEEMPSGFQHQECCLLWVCHIWCLSCWGTFPLYPLSEGFFKIMNGCWTLPQAFSASSQMITWFQLFNLSVQCVTLIDLWILKKPCVRDKSCLITVSGPLLLDSVCHSFVEGFCVYVHQWRWPVLFFLRDLCLVWVSG